uniref:hypothetical protein n=1 Tax=Mycobacterium avium TaxID=1764 RepID=UPI001E615780
MVANRGAENRVTITSTAAFYSLWIRNYRVAGKGNSGARRGRRHGRRRIDQNGRRFRRRRRRVG